MPRALTEQEKCVQSRRMLEKGKAVVLSHGIKKVSVDDIVKAANIAKGSFYQHFESKDNYLFELIRYMYESLYTQVEQMIKKEGDLMENLRNFLRQLLNMPELHFFIQNSDFILSLIESMPDTEMQSAKSLEAGMYEKLLRMAGIDVTKVKPGVIHNYIHMLYLATISDIMIKEDMPETFERVMDSLTIYIFSGGAPSF